MEIQEVNNKEARKEFLQLPVRLYKEEPRWIRPLDKDIESVFDPKQNKFFRHGECTRWVLKDQQGKTIGRIAAFVDKKTASKDNDQPTGGVGFFECINDKKAAFKLFDTAKAWLAERGMEAMDGPINFGERNKWWGLLIDGFEYQPNYCCNYNFPYYQELFEAYGFREFYKQFTYGRKVMDPLPENMALRAERIERNPDYKFVPLDKKNQDKFTEDFRQVYNKAWINHKGVPKMSSLQAKSLMKEINPILDENIMWYGYYKDEPIAFFIMLPEINQIIKYLNGKMNLLGKLKFLWHQWRQSCRKMFGVVFGVVPEHQGKGIEGAIVMAARQKVQVEYQRYEDFEMNWIGDFNPEMIHLVEQVGAELRKTHITYRKLFDESRTFERAPQMKT